MTQSSVLLLALISILLGGSLSWLWLKNLRLGNRELKILVVLRACTLSILIFLLIAPALTLNSYTVEKPKLLLLRDRSKSMDQLVSQGQVDSLIQAWKEDADINERFDVAYFGFDNQLISSDSISEGSVTDQGKALRQLTELFPATPQSVLIFTDGVQTSGRPYEFLNLPEQTKVYPILLGDTSAVTDLAITQVNVNRYVTLGNTFEAEVLLRYEGSEPVTSQLEVYQGTKKLYSTSVAFSDDKRSDQQFIKLEGKKPGYQKFVAKVRPLDREKVIRNNEQPFATEVLDQRLKMVLISSVSHPDIGTFQRMIDNRPYLSLDVKKPEEWNTADDYGLYIMYEPGVREASLMKMLLKRNIPTLYISSKFEVDMELPGVSLSGEGVTEDLQGIVNTRFEPYQLNDWNPETYPPLQGQSKELVIRPDCDVLLYASVAGIPTKQPLLFTCELEGDSRFAVLAATGFWKWRMETFREFGTFDGFDQFMLSLLQFLGDDQPKDRLQVEIAPYFFGSSRAQAEVRVYDENYSFDTRAILNARITDSLGNTKRYPVPLQSDRYLLSLSTLEPGTYTLEVETADGLKEERFFDIIPFDRELQATRVNGYALEQFSLRNRGALIPSDSMEYLKQLLLSDPLYIPRERKETSYASISEWEILLWLVSLFLALEWFYRKYRGLL